jgi:hypothetical protein
MPFYNSFWSLFVHNLLPCGIQATADGTHSSSAPGQAYLVFGTNASLSSKIDLDSLDGSNGVAFTGTADSDYFG